MSLRYLLFELTTPDGHKYKLYLDGHSEGFPEGTIIYNNAHALFCAGIKNVPCPDIPDVDNESVVP